MAKIGELKVGLHVEYRIVFFPFATYKRIEDVEYLSVLGVKVWKRVGGVSRLFGLNWGSNAA